MKTFRPFFERIATANKRMAIVFYPSGRGEPSSIDSLLDLNDPSIIGRKKEGDDVIIILGSPVGVDALTKRALQHTHGIDADPFLVDEDGMPAARSWTLYNLSLNVDFLSGMTLFLEEILFTGLVPEPLRKEIALELEKEGTEWLDSAEGLRVQEIIEEDLRPKWKAIFEDYHDK